MVRGAFPFPCTRPVPRSAETRPMWGGSWAPEPYDPPHIGVSAEESGALGHLAENVLAEEAGDHLVPELGVLG